MAGLLAAEGPTLGVQGLEHVTVAYSDRVDVDAGRRHSLVKTEVGHHRDDDGPTHQQSPLGQVGGEQSEQAVPVDHVAGGVDGDHPVGVPVEGQAEVGPLVHHRLGQATGVGRAAPVVDVGPVRLGRQHAHYFGARRREDLGGAEVSGAVGAVEGYPQAVQVPSLQAAQHVVLVAGQGPQVRADAPHARSGGCSRAFVCLQERLELSLEPVLDVVRELGAPGGKELDAVVPVRVVRRRNDSRRRTLLGRQEGHRRSGQDAHVDHVDAFGRQPGR